MLGNLALIALQFAGAFWGAPYVLAKIPVTGDPRMFVHAAIFAVIVWVTGLVGSFVLKDVRMPNSTGLASALIGALVGAAITFVPQIMQAIPLKFPPIYLPLAGAIAGYFIRRG